MLQISENNCSNVPKISFRQLRMYLIRYEVDKLLRIFLNSFDIYREGTLLSISEFIV